RAASRASARTACARADLRCFPGSWRSWLRMQQSRGIKDLAAPIEALARRTSGGMKRRGKAVRKAKSPARSRAAKKHGGTPDALDALVTAAAQALALPIDPAWRGNIKFNLQLALTMAARVDEFPLPDTIDPAPVFHA